MSEQTEVNYLDGDVVWVKLGSCWWPGEVVGHEKLPPDVLPSFRKPPIAIVKFFQEDSYEYVKNQNSIYKYNCSRKDEFIQKGLYLYRTKHGLMEKFPEDVIRAETAIGGDVEILTREEFQETKKESYAGLFGNPNKKTPATNKKGKGGKGRVGDLSKFSTPIRKIKEKSNYKVHILVQASKTPSQAEETTPSTSRAGSEPAEEKSQETNVEESSKSATFIPTPTASSTGIYACHACPFTTTRLNVLILHNKTHSATFTPYTPSPIKKKLSPKAQKSTPKGTPKTPKSRKPRQDKGEKSPRKNQAQKREAETETLPEVKKIKTDEEIKSSLLADWDDGDEDSNGESSTIAMAASPDVPIAAGSPAVPTPAELPSAQVPIEDAPLPEKKKAEDKPESSNDAKYEFCEDEDWPVEADVGRKIPRVKKPSIRKEETKSLSIDEDDMAREVAELLNKTTVPELPSVPEPLKVEENFPEPSIVKSPDKQCENSPEGNKSSESKETPECPPPKTIFKTKTFFRSRHSRSQDAIGKYVAEQLNAERHDITDSEINGSDMTLSLEPRISPPIEHVKVARLAPKIQLKKMNAEAQWREREKNQIQDEIKRTYSKTDTLKLEKDSLNGNNDYKVIQKNDETSNSDFGIAKNKDKVSDNDLIKNDNGNDKLEDNSNLDLMSNIDENKESISNSNNSEILTPIESCTDEPEKKLSNENKSFEPYMSESTASAVDALLSVSREADRVTKVISDDPPEDLFEDDNKDSANGPINGCDEKVKEKEIKSNDNIILDQDSENMETMTEAIQSNFETNIQTEIRSPEVVSEKQPNNEKQNQEEILQDEILSSPVNLNSAKTNENTEPVGTENILELVSSSIPSESDLQVAEALINLPSTTIQNKAIDTEDKITLISPSQNEKSKELLEISHQILQSDTFGSTDTQQTENDSHQDDVSLINTTILTNNIRFESEEEKSENLNAAQSLVQMSESIDHKINISEIKTTPPTQASPRRYSKAQDVSSYENTVDNKLAKLPEKINDTINGNSVKTESTPRLLKILEEPCTSHLSITNNSAVSKKVIVSNKEKLLNIDVAKSALKPKPQSTKQKIIIRRTAPNKTLLNNVTEVTTPDKIILSRTNKPSEDGSSVQSYTIQTTPDVSTTDNNTIIIQQKIRKIAKPNPKLQRIKPQSTVTTLIDSKTVKEVPKANETVFDINSMPIVLSEDILTPESIEKMPFVMSDGNLITTSNTTKVTKNKKVITNSEKITVTSSNKTDVKTLIHHTPHENKTTAPNILSKSSKLRGSAKPMLVIDKTTGKQQIIMTKSEPPIKEVKQPPTIIQTLPQSSTKSEKFIILPSATSPRPGRAQKIVIDPQTGKAHVVVGKGPETTTTVADNKPVSAKLLPSASDTNTSGNTVMIITNAQGTQSRIVLTPEHEKILFPNKQQASISQLKTINQRISTNAPIQQKNIVTTVASVKTPTRIVSKQKGAIITSKGQLIVGGRLATTTQNIAPLPEIRPAPKRITGEPKKIIQSIQKNSSEPLIFLQKSGAVMQLTAAQFEHLQRTGQIIQKVPAQSQDNKVIVQKTITISPTDTLVPVQKQRVRKHPAESPTPMKKLKHEIAIAPAPAPSSPMPTLTPICSTNISLGSTLNNSKSMPSSSNYSNIDNFEELLPTTAIARSNETVVAQTEQNAQSAAPLSDGQLLAVPGEHFGGPHGSFYLCVEENGTFTPIDNRPLVLENNQLVPMAEPVPVLVPQTERRDILEAALANSDVFHAESTQNEAPDFRDLNANVSVHCRVSETSTTLNQPIMTPVEVPTKVDTEPAIPSSLDDGLAVIGVTPHSVPTSLELPITVTDPRIAPKTTDPLSNSNYRTSLLPSPNTEMTFVVTEETDIPSVGPISMPLLTEEESVGKSMPILTDEITERTISSVESTVGSPSSIDVRESETEDGSQWPRRLLTPGSDISEASVEIPLQPAIQLSVNDLSNNNS